MESLDIKHLVAYDVILADVICASELYVACSLKCTGNIAVWSVPNEAEGKHPAILSGHHLPVHALALSHASKSLLCSCSSDNIILWDLSENNGHAERGKVLLSNARGPFTCTFNDESSKLLVGCGTEVILFLLAPFQCTTVLVNSHYIAHLKFCGSSIIITCDEGSFCKVWNLGSGHTQAKKQVLIATGSISTLSVDGASGLVAVGATTGDFYIFSYNSEILRCKKVWKLANTFMCSGTKCSWETDCGPIVALYFFKTSGEGSEAYKYLPETMYLLLVTNSFLIIYDINPDNVVYFLDFRDDIKSKEHLGLITSATAYGTSDRCVSVILLPVLNQSILTFKLCPKVLQAPTDSSSPKETCDNLTFLCRKVEEASLLNCKKQSLEMKTKRQSSTKGCSSKMFQPLTFHSKVKSSGYGMLHSSQMFQSQKSTNLKRQKSAGSTVIKPLSGLSLSSSDSNSLFKNKPRLSNEISLSSTASLLCTKFSGDGQYALCSYSTGVVDILQICKSHVNLYTSTKCHNKIIESINWSHSKNLWLSGSRDEFAYMWSCKNLNQGPMLTFSQMPCGQKCFMKTKHVNHPGFKDGVSSIQFYYLDQFVLLSSKNCVYLFNYEIGLKESAIGRSSNTSHCELLSSLPMEYMDITAVAAVNQYFSNLLVCAGSSKCIDVIDANVLKSVWHADCVSNKPVYLIGINEGSSLWQQPTCMYDIFFTCSHVDGIKLWDLRSQRPALNYCEHNCRSISCGASFSACGRYIVSGSENKSVYVYDLRSLSSVYRLTLPSDIITSTSSSPSKDLLLASALDGHLYAFT